MTLAAGIGAALKALLAGDLEVYSIAYASIRFAVASTTLASVIGIPLGCAIGLADFPGRNGIRSILSSLMAIPTVVIGLFVYSLLSRSGPAGRFGLLYTPAAIILGQSLLSIPIIASLVSDVLSDTDPRLMETLQTLSVGTFRKVIAVLSEYRTAVLAAVVAGFGRVIGEVGVSMMLGGNIRWYTRTLTTAIALETSKGQFELGLALGLVLLIAALAVNFLLRWTVRRG